MKAIGEVLSKWRALGAADPRNLVAARLQLHHALQIIVSAPISHLPARADDSHTNLEWLPPLEALGTNLIDGAQRIRYALRPGTLSLLAIDEHGALTAELALDGRTTNDAVAWLRDSLAEAGYDRASFTTNKHYEIPSHPVASGAAYSLVAEEHTELGLCYGNAHALATHVAATRPAASAPRCWPHHCDLATLITLPSPPGGGTRTVGVGMSPGDDLYAEPYLYVGPYPHPPVDRLRPLGALGTWHTKWWVGAVLRATEIVALGDAQAQAEGVVAFCNAAIEASLNALR